MDKKRLNRYKLQIVYLVIILIILVFFSLLLKIMGWKNSKEQEIKELLKEVREEQNLTKFQFGIFDENSSKGIVKECKESWFCTDWSDCRDNIQKRACLDSNNCKTTTKKPLIEQACYGNFA